MFELIEEEISFVVVLSFTLQLCIYLLYFSGSFVFGLCARIDGLLLPLTNRNLRHKAEMVLFLERICVLIWTLLNK